MTLRRQSNRWAAWAFAFALLLKAAVPLLATLSAQVQGKALVEVCTVYGVATVALDGTPSAPAHDGAPSHAGEHCALSAVVALSAPESPLPNLPRQVLLQMPGLACSTPVPPDASAEWAARLTHAPPLFA